MCSQFSPTGPVDLLWSGWLSLVDIQDNLKMLSGSQIRVTIAVTAGLLLLSLCCSGCIVIGESFYIHDHAPEERLYCREVAFMDIGEYSIMTGASSQGNRPIDESSLKKDDGSLRTEECVDVTFQQGFSARKITQVQLLLENKCKSNIALLPGLSKLIILKTYIDTQPTKVNWEDDIPPPGSALAPVHVMITREGGAGQVLLYIPQRQYPHGCANKEYLYEDITPEQFVPSDALSNTCVSLNNWKSPFIFTFNVSGIQQAYLVLLFEMDDGCGPHACRLTIEKQ